MKIGEVSKKYDVSIDTINYYIKTGLLVPQTNSLQRDFDKETLRDLELILEHKDLDFSLNEIHKILSLYRISNLTDAKDIGDLRQIYINKKDECLQKEKALAVASTKLIERIENLGIQTCNQAIQTGVPLSMLDLLVCPSCQERLTISDANMDFEYIFSGSLFCKCGYHAKIENGILITPNKNIDVYDTPDIHRNTYKDLPPHLITLFQKSYNWMIKQIEKVNFDNKVVLETYINAWFFMHNHQKNLSSEGKYIVIDKYPETLLMYKKIIEAQNFNNKILYIADSSTNFPLKKNSIDIKIDFFAINEHNFYHDTFLIDEIYSYLKDTSKIIGTYFYFKNEVNSMKQLIEEYPTCYHKNFNFNYFSHSLTSSNYQIFDHEHIGHTTDSGYNIGFSFHNKGEEMHLYSYLANRNNS